MCRMDWRSSAIWDRLDDIMICSYQGGKPIVCCTNVVAGGRLGFVSEATKRSKSYRKCKYYADELEELHDVPVLLAYTVTSNHSECPIAPDGTQLIVGGTQAELDEFPHMAALGFGPRESVEWRCGGSLISEKFILTAAHCTFAAGLGNVAWARLGSVFLTDSSPNVVLLRIINITRHPEYKARVNYHDIALLELEQSVELTTSVRPACIHHVDGDTAPDLVPLVTGWGSMYVNGPTSQILQKAELRFVATASCRISYTQLALTRQLSRNIDDDIMICAGDPKGMRDTCNGDSGGPIQLVLAEPSCMYGIIGVTSFGPVNCGNSATPGVYTKVKSYIPWIESIVWPYG